MLNSFLPHHTMAVDLSQAKMTTLSDNTVSRMMAARALHDHDYRKLLLEYIGLPVSFAPLRAKDKKFEPLFRSIRDLRQQLADKAMLDAPRDSAGHRRELSTYLKQVLHSRVLVPNRALTQGGVEEIAEVGNKGWGWVVSHQVCLIDLASLPLTRDIHGILHAWLRISCSRPSGSRPILPHFHSNAYLLNFVCRCTARR